MRYKYIIEFNPSKDSSILELFDKKNNGGIYLFAMRFSKNTFNFEKVDKKGKIVSISEVFLNKKAKAFIKSITAKKKAKIVRNIRKTKVLKRESVLSMSKILKELKKMKYNKIGDLRIYKTNKDFYKIFDKEFNYLKSIK